MSPTTNCVNPQIELDRRHVVHTMVNRWTENNREKNCFFISHVQLFKLQKFNHSGSSARKRAHTHLKCGKVHWIFDCLLKFALHVTDSSGSIWAVALRKTFVSFVCDTDQNSMNFSLVLEFLIYPMIMIWATIHKTFLQKYMKYLSFKHQTKLE